MPFMQPNPSPFQAMGKPPTGPTVTPATANAAGKGGQQNPAYLQMRTPTPNMPQANGTPPTKPVVTPQASAPGDTVAPTPFKPVNASSQPNQPQITPSGSQPPQAGGTDLGSVYNFFKSDLDNQRKQATSNSIADASARGVYYGTPLTGSEADINTQYLRGLGQLQSGMYGNQQNYNLAQEGLASGLGWQSGMNAPPAPGPMDWSGLGALFGNSNSNPTAPASGQTPATSTNRTGPVVTPKPTKSGEGAKNPYSNQI